MNSDRTTDRRRFFRDGSILAACSAAGLTGLTVRASARENNSGPMVHSVLGPVAPDQLGVTLMHEHAPLIDWSELYDTPAAPFQDIQERMLDHTAGFLDAFHNSLAADEGPGAIVEVTPVRVGRYPRLLAELAKRTKVHVIGATGFWCEAMAPQHPWAVRMSVAKDGTREMAEFFIREITQGMEDPAGAWGKKFTDVCAGVIKIGTSTYLRPSERICHIAAAICSKETGCPITTHTTNGGGLEEAHLLLKHGGKPERVVIGHQGYQDDREHDEAVEYHRLIANMGCYVQFDRVGQEKYPIDSQARQITKLIEAGFAEQVLVSHDDAAWFYPDFAGAVKSPDGWEELEPDFTLITTKLVAELKRLGTSKSDIRKILIDNPRRVLAF